MSWWRKPAAIAAAFFENLGFTKDHETADAVVYTLEF